ncbi:asparagine synthase-related protein [Sphingomonas sp. M1-B02]|uniref:asparagine synthase-related protein n=1 Tax=Sphingomonas sp. M1-B02 TaxID=3114300 RepID=UPI0022402999|nr:asparagine synthetase B family protein [Sphingomonas sp. S6-11]UZK67854.1 asparagine synthase-related protein [Sphingomonas sp. S6-11]
MPPAFFILRHGHAGGPPDGADRFADAILREFPGVTRVIDNGVILALAAPGHLQSIDGETPNWILGDVCPSGGLAMYRSAARTTPDGRSAALARTLTRTCWGSYVALLGDGADAFVLRDPSGGVPLFVLGGRGITIAATALTPRLLRAAGLPPDPDLNNVAHVLAHPPAAAHLSLLKGISIVTPGDAVLLAEPERRETVWSPASIAATPQPLTPGDILATLDAVTGKFATDKLTGVELSGGFDSSSVFASLAATGRRMRPFNVATASSAGDERNFARSVAARWSTPLREFEAGAALPDYGPLLDLHHEVQPALTGLDSVFAAARETFAAEEKLDLVMTGQGGDALFFQLPTRLVAVDRLQAQGLRGLAVTKLRDDAVRSGSSIWSVAATAMGVRMEADRDALPPLTPHLLGHVSLGALQRPAPTHPWLSQGGKLPPAKRRHLMMLANSQLVHGPRLFHPSAPLHHPLLAQPLVERLLACPVHLLAKGPLDRGLARDAMRDRLSEAVLHRRSKGEASDHYARAVLHNRDWLLSVLLDGALARAGLIDRQAVEQALQIEQIAISTDYRAFAVYACLEAWLRYWTAD